MIPRRVIEHVKAQNWTAVGLDFVIVAAPSETSAGDMRIPNRSRVSVTAEGMPPEVPGAVVARPRLPQLGCSYILSTY